MKVTSYELSKKLAEIGFKSESEKVYIEAKHTGSNAIILASKNELQHLNELLRYEPDYMNPIYLCDTYDLETILEALPAQVNYKKKVADFTFYKNLICYEIRKDERLPEFIFSEFINDNSMADTAARLLITLHEKGIIKFKN